MPYARQSIIWLLFRLPYLRTRNNLQNLRSDDLVKHTFLIAFGIGVCWAEYLLFLRFWNVLKDIPMGFPVALPRMTSFVGSMMFAFLTYSSVLTALSALYKSDDVALFLIHPMPQWVILLYKWFEIGTRSATTFIALSIPPFIALSQTLTLPWQFYPIFLLTVCSLAAMAVSIGTMLSMVLMTLFPERRLHQSIAIVGLCMAALLITGLRFLNLESLWGENPGASQIVQFFTERQQNWLEYAPAIFMTNAIMPFIWGQDSGWPWILGGVAGGLMSIGIVLAVGSRLFLIGWRKCQEQADPAIHEGFTVPKQSWQRIPLPRGISAMMQKDWILLRREPTIWTQLFMMVPLAAMYIINLSFLPLGLEDLRLMFTVSNIALIGLIVSAVSSRFLFPTRSREGKAVWIPSTAPFSSGEYMIQKILFACPPVILLSICLVLISSMMMKLPSSLFLWSMVYGIASSAMLCILAVSLGCIFPVFDYRNLMEVSLGKGSLLYMLLAIVEIGTLVYASLRGAFSQPTAELVLTSPPLLLWIAGWFVITSICFFLGKRQIERMELMG